MNLWRLPHSTKVPVAPLAQAFDDVTNSYKFFWFMGILESVKRGEQCVSLSRLVSRMVAFAWFPSVYFRLSFGKQDRLATMVWALQKELDIPINVSRARVEELALAQVEGSTKLGKHIRSLMAYVPQRFLRPFFQEQLRGIPDQKVNREIRRLAEIAASKSEAATMYKFSEQQAQLFITITDAWYKYLCEHISILEGFCFWKLVEYLEKNNPNIPNIASKIIAPAARDLRTARFFWDNVLPHLGDEAVCIYSGKRIMTGSYTLDHFIPWRFVAHDLLWNLIPASKEANLRKSDWLPDVDSYLLPFCKLQYVAVQAALRIIKNVKVFEDYLMLFRTSALADLRVIPLDQFQKTLKETVIPQIQIARNMGFPYGWIYRALVGASET